MEDRLSMTITRKPNRRVIDNIVLELLEERVAEQKSRAKEEGVVQEFTELQMKWAIGAFMAVNLILIIWV